MSSEINKQAQELTKRFYGAIDKKVTPALFKQGIGYFRSIMNVYTFEELCSMIKYIEEGNMPDAYSPGILSYRGNKILDAIKLKEMKSAEHKVSVMDMKVKNEKKANQSSFFDKFM